MYGHQVIEDLKKYELLSAQNIKARDSLILKILSSQHFYIGSYYQLTKVVANLNGKPLLNTGVSTNIRLPYNSCFFSYDVFAIPETGNHDRIRYCPEKEAKISYKKAVLVYETNPHRLKLISFQFRAGYNTDWFAIPTIGTFDFGLSDEQYDSNSMHTWLSPLSIYPNVDETEIRRWEEVVKDNASAINVALVLLNCKNIITKKNIPPEKLNRSRNKKGKTPLFSYHTLKLKLPARQKERDFDHQALKLTKRLHLCRGHIKHYTRESPLFGKFTGSYWWPAHVRGDKTKGIVIKDYYIQSDDQ